jgi:hypothetical protein
MPQDQEGQQAEKQTDLASEYDFEASETSFDPELDGTDASTAADPAASEPAAASPTASPETRQRDSAGRFIATAPAEPTKHIHSKRLTRMAQDLGIPQEEIDSTPSEALDDTVYHLNRQLLEMSAQDRRGKSLGENRPPSSGPPQDADGLADGRDASPEEDIDPDSEQFQHLDNDLLNLIKHQQRRIKRLEDQASRQEVSRRNEPLNARLDRAFAKYSDVLGKGSRADLAQDSKEFRDRIRVLEIAERLGSDPGTLEDRIDRAVKAAFGDRLKTEQEEGGTPTSQSGHRTGHLERELERRREIFQSTVAKPTQRRGLEEPKGTRRAEKAVAQRLREQGLNLDEFAEENGLPE